MNFVFGQNVLVRWHDGWRSATVAAVRETNLSVRPGCVKVLIPKLGAYNVPKELIRLTPPSPEEAISEEQRKEIWMRVSGGWTDATPE